MPQTDTAAEPTPEYPPCREPAKIREEVAAYDRLARVDQWRGPRYRMTYRVLGEGPPLVLVPGIASTYRGYAMTLNRLAEHFQTIVYDYPGENPGDKAQLGAIRHEDLVSDLFGLLEHLRIGRAFLFGMSFGTTISLAALHREPRRFPRATLQGAFAHRRFTIAERFALGFGRRFPGRIARLPFHEQVLTWNNRREFPSFQEDRWAYYLEQNGLTSIAGITQRLDLLAQLDLRPILPQIPNNVLVIQGQEDRIILRSHFDEVTSLLPEAQGLLLPVVGHQPHFTHPEQLAQIVGSFLLPSCSMGVCPSQEESPGEESESDSNQSQSGPSA